MANDKDGPAFPVHLADGEKWIVESDPHGMSLRAYVATAALQGLLDRRDIGGSIPAHATLADTAVELADALIAELAKERT